jgi:hypothetical protein
MTHFAELLNSWLELLQHLSEQPSAARSNASYAMRHHGRPTPGEPSRWHDWPYGL